MPWAAAAAVGGAIISGSMASDAAGDAADAQSASSARSIAEQRRQYDLNRQDQAQYMKTGQGANKTLASLLGIGDPAMVGGTTAYKMPSYADILAYNTGRGGSSQDADIQMQAIQRGDFGSAEDVYNQYKNAGFDLGSSLTTQGGVADPNYGSLLKKFSSADLNADPVYQSGLQFGLDQGTGAINARALAGGSYDSGATLKALTRYANDYGSTKANESYNRYNATNDSIYNKLAGVSGAGQTATQQVGSAGANAANQISGALTDQGSARAAGIVGGANAWGDAIGGIGSNANNYNKWLKGMSSGSGGSSDGFYPGTYNGPVVYGTSEGE
jgi:hypothetical protein